MLHLDQIRLLSHYPLNLMAVTRRVRSLWLYLERHPVHELQEWDETAHPQPWLLKAIRTGH